MNLLPPKLKPNSTVSHSEPLALIMVCLFMVLGFSAYLWGESAIRSWAALDVPQVISLQGKLTDENRITVDDAPLNMQFTIWDSATATADINCLWTASGTCASKSTISVTPQDGVFSVLLGDSGQNAIPDDVFTSSSDRWIGIKIGSDSEMSPRIKLGSVPSAINAGLLEGMSVSQSGGDAVILATESDGDLVLTSGTNNRIGIGTSDLNATLSVEGTSRFGTGSASYDFVNQQGYDSNFFFYTATADGASTYGFPTGIYNLYMEDPTSNTSNAFSGFRSDVWLSSLNDAGIDYTGTSYAGDFYLSENGTGNITTAGGIQAIARNKNGTATNVRGGTFGGWTTHTATTDYQTGVYVNNYINTGHVGADYGLYIASPTLASGGSIRDAHGIAIGNMDVGSGDNYSIYSGGGKSYFQDEVGIATTSPSALLNVEAAKDSVTDVSYFGVPASSLGGQGATYAGLASNIFSAYNNDISTSGYTIPIMAIAQTDATNDYAQAIMGVGEALNASGTVARTIGVAGSGYLSANGTLTDLMGLYSEVGNLASGTVTNAYGAYLSGHDSSNAVTNSYGLYINSNLDLGSTSSYGVYQAGSGMDNYFAGNMLIEGTTTLGNATTDHITFTGYAASDLIPATDDIYDLGSSNRRWQDVYVGPATIHIGNNPDDEITLSFDDTGELKVRGGDLSTETGGMSSPHGGFGKYENRLSYSEVFENVAWSTTGGVTVTDNNTVSPQGSTTAARLADDGTGGGTVEQTITIPAAGSTPYTFSVWIKDNNTTNTVAIRVTDLNGTGGGTSFINLDPGDKWNRYAVTHTPPADTTSIKVSIEHDNVGSNSFYVFGAQILQDSKPGVYVKTEGNPLTDPKFGFLALSGGPHSFVKGDVGVGTTSPNEKFTVEGAISLDEITAPSETSGYGKIYVKDTDSLLYFKDDSGTEHGLTTGSAGAANFDEVYAESVSDANLIMEIDSVSGLTFEVASGDFILTQSGSPFATFDTSGNVQIANDIDLGSSSADRVTVNGLIDSSLLPTGAVSLGSSTQRWADLYLTGSSLHLGPSSSAELVIGYTDAGTDIVTLDTSSASADLAFNTNQFYIDTSAASVGIGTDSPAGSLDVVGSGYPIIRGTRETSETNINRSVAGLRHTTSADMVDGFGVDLAFQLRDSAGVDNTVGKIGVNRDGADNSGSMVFRVSNAGTFNEGIVIRSNGDVGIGTDAPSSPLEVVGTGTVLTLGAGNTSDISILFNENATDGTITWDASADEVELSNNFQVLGNALIGNSVANDNITFNASILNYTGNTALVFEGATDNSARTYFTVTDPTTNRFVTLPDAGGTIHVSGQSTTIDDLTVTGSSTIGDTPFVDTISLEGQIQEHSSGYSLIFEGDTDNVYETMFIFTDPTQDNYITFPDDTGTVAFLSDITGATGWTDSGTQVHLTTSTDSVGIGVATADGKLEVRNSGSQDIFNLYDSTTNVFTVVDGGYVGIGQTDPTYALDIEGPAVPGQEQILHTTVADDSESFFSLSNSTNSGGNYVPMLWGHNGSSLSNMVFQGTTTATGDTGTNAVMGFTARQWDGASHGSVATKDLFSWENNGAEVMVIDVDGDVGIGEAAPDAVLDVYDATRNTASAHDYGLSVDVTGNTDDSSFNLYAGNFSASTTGNLNTVYGLNSSVTSSNASGNIVRGIVTNATNNLGSLSTIGNYIDVNGTSTGDKIGSYILTGGSGDGYGVYVRPQSSGTNYGIYASNEDYNYFSGSVGIGDSTPTNFALEVAGHVGPNTNDTYDLGSTLLRWRDLYLGPASLHIGKSGSEDVYMAYIDSATDYLNFNTSVSTVDIAFNTDSLYVDFSTGRIGMGTDSPSNTLTIIDPSETTAARLVNYGANGPDLYMMHATGTEGSPSYPGNADNLGTMVFGGYSNSDFQAGAAILASTSEAWDDTSRGTRLRFFTVENGNTGALARMTIDHDGNVGIGTTAPTAKLNVAGAKDATTDLISFFGVPESSWGGTASSSYTGKAMNTFAAYNSDRDGTDNLGTIPLFSLGQSDQDGSAGNIYGSFSMAEFLGTAATADLIAGAVNTAQHSASGGVTDIVGTYTTVNGSGSMDNAYGQYIRMTTDATNSYGLLIYKDVFSSPGTHYGIYETGPSTLNYFSGDTGIGDDSPDGKLEVRQTAAADIFNLYDNTTNVFTVEDGGDVGIGLSNPTSKLHVADESKALLSLYTATDSASSSEIELFKGDGTLASPGATDNGEYLGTIWFGGYDGDSWEQGAFIASDATDAWTNSSRGSNIQFWTPDNDTISQDLRMIIDHDGEVGIGASSPDAQLEIEDTNGTADTDYTTAHFTLSGTHPSGSTDGSMVGLDIDNDAIFTGTAAPGTRKYGAYILLNNQWDGESYGIRLANNGNALDTNATKYGIDIRAAGNVYADTYGAQFDNSTTNSYTTGSATKYGVYINSSGDFGGTTGVSTTNYGLYVNTPSGADSNYAAVFEGGNVGIGITTPNDPLDVVGDIDISDGSAYQIDDVDMLSTNSTKRTINIGSGAGGSSSADYNVFIGEDAGNDNTSGLQGTFVGWHAGDNNTTGTLNTFIGSQAGGAITEGGANTFIGQSAGLLITTGTNNVMVGRAAGSGIINGSGNVFIGQAAGSDETGSNRLHITNTNDSTPLIYGEFDNDLLKVYGRQQVVEDGLAASQTVLSASSTSNDLSGEGGSVGYFTHAPTYSSGDPGTSFNGAVLSAISLPTASSYNPTMTGRVFYAAMSGIPSGGTFVNTNTKIAEFQNLTSDNAGTVLYAQTNANSTGDGFLAQFVSTNEATDGEFVVRSNGTVQIGIVSPGAGNDSSAKLDVRGAAIFNEEGDNADFRVESDTRSNMIFMDADGFSGAGAVGIGTSTMTNYFQVYRLIDFDNTNQTTTLGMDAHYGIVSGAVNNTAVGYQSQYFYNGGSPGGTTAADRNTSTGYRSLFNLYSGYDNTAIGSTAGYNINAGYGNTALGSTAGNAITNGDYNTMIGYGSDVTSTGINNSTAIGYNAQVSCSNCVVLGSGDDVGINVSDPDESLEINGNIKFNESNTNKKIMFPNSSYSLYLGGEATDTNPYVLAYYSQNSHRFNISDSEVARIDSTGLGVNTSGAPTVPIHVEDPNTGYVGYFLHSGTASNSNSGIVIRAGAATNPSSTANFILFQDGDGTSIGAVEGDGSGGVTNASAGSDYAELFPGTAADFATGDLISVSSSGTVVKATADQSLIGALSQRAHTLGNWEENWDSNPNLVPVGLVGQIEVKVNSENGSIAAGDLITVSSTAGVGMKATDPGQVLGTALEAWAGPGQSTIEVYVKPHWNASGIIADDGTYNGSFQGNMVFDKTGTATTDTNGFDSHSLTFRGSGWNTSTSTADDVEMTLVTDVTDTDDYSLSIKNTAGTQVAMVTNEGDLAIAGKLYPSAEGALQTDSYLYYGGATDDYMRTNASGWGTGSYDFAEMFPSTQELEAGELVVFASQNEHVRRSTTAFDNKLAGIVSTKPGFLAGDNDKGSYPIALAGRVPTKVNLEGGNIEVGDPITSSSISGQGMKASEAGTVVGYALEPYSGAAGQDNEIIVFVNPSYYAGDGSVPDAGQDNTTSGTTSSNLTSLNMEGNIYMHGNAIKTIGLLEGLSNIWSLNADGTFKTSGSISLVTESYQGEDVETPVVANMEHKITLDGTGTIQNGQASITFENVDPEFNDITSTTAPIRVVVTANGPANLYVADKDHNGFTVQQIGGSDSDITFDWLVTAYRKDFEPVEEEPTEEPPVEDPIVIEDPVVDPDPTATTDTSDTTDTTDTTDTADTATTDTTDPIVIEPTPDPEPTSTTDTTDPVVVTDPDPTATDDLVI